MKAIVEEVCAGCGRQIQKSETVHVSGDKVICDGCKKRREPPTQQREQPAERCDRCGAAIEEDEPPHVVDAAVVCPRCHSKAVDEQVAAGGKSPAYSDLIAAATGVRVFGFILRVFGFVGVAISLVACFAAANMVGSSMPSLLAAGGLLVWSVLIVGFGYLFTLAGAAGEAIRDIARKT